MKLFAAIAGSKGERPEEVVERLLLDLKTSQALCVASIFSAVLCLFQLALPLFSMQIFDRVLPGASLPTLVTLSALMVGLLTSAALVDASRAMILTRIAGRIRVNLYRDASEAALNGDGDGISVVKDIELIRQFVSGPVASALLDAPWSLTFLIAIFMLHSILGWFALLAAAIMLALGFVSHFATSGPRSRSASLQGGCANVLNDALKAGDAIIAMGMQGRLLDKLLSMRQQSVQVGRIASERQAWLDASSRGLRNLMQVAVLALAASLVLTSGLNTGAIVASSMLFSRAIGPIERLGGGAHTLATALSAFRRLSTLSSKFSAKRQYIEFPALEGLVVAHNVSLTTPQRQAYVLQNINLTVKPGNVLVIVGREGAGKSSLAKVLAGVTRATTGVVRIDNTDILHFRPSSLGNQIGFVSEVQDFCIGNILSFVARGNDADPGEVIRVCKLLNVHSVIQQLPLGYQTEIADKSSPLSTGERRRIALARAFYGRPRIMILDEPTACLDDNGEAVLLSALQEAKRSGCTIIIVSRLPGLLHLADQLVMLDKGVVTLAADQLEMQQFLVPRLATSSR